MFFVIGISSCFVLPCFATGCHAFGLKIATAALRPRNDTKMVGFAIKPTIFIPEMFEIRRGATLRRASTGTASAERPCGAPRRALESVKKHEALFIAPTARQILHETAQRVLRTLRVCAAHGILDSIF